MSAPATDVRFPDEFNLADYFLFDRLAEGLGDEVALRYGDRRWTYREVADRSAALARALIADGLLPEERVHVVLPDAPPFAWSIFAILAAGATLTMGNPAAPAGTEPRTWRGTAAPEPYAAAAPMLP